MRRVWACLAAIVLAAALTLGTGACGGGGGTAPAASPLALFNGSYFYQAYAGNPAPVVAFAWWGTLAADGAGTMTGGTQSWNSAGAVSTAAIPPFNYTIDANRRVIWAAGTPFELTGGISADGRVSVLGPTATGSFPGLAIALRQAGSFGLGSLNGVYHLAAIARAGANHQAYWGLATFNGAGNVTYGLARNDHGTVGLVGFPAATYALAADGTLDLVLGGQNFRGGLLAGGELAVLSGTTSPSSPTELVVLLRASTAASDATFSGTYHHARLTAQLLGPPEWTAFTGLLTVNGAGGLVVQGGTIVNQDGAISLVPANLGSNYAVQVNGALVALTNSMAGAVSPTGDFAVLAGRTPAASTPELWFCVR